MLPLQNAAMFIFGWLYRLIFRVKVVGKENIPSGGAVIACNHIHALDPVTVGSCLPRGFNIMAKAELFKNPVAAFFMRGLGAFPVKRGAGDVGAINTAGALLDKGRLLLIFPEGTRSATGEMGRIKSGTLAIALRAGAPVVPVYVTAKRGVRPFAGIVIQFGEPVPAEAFFDGADADHLRKTDYAAANARLAASMQALRREDVF